MNPGPSSPSVYHFSTISIYLNMSMGWLFFNVLGSSSFEKNQFSSSKPFSSAKGRCGRPLLMWKVWVINKLQPLQQPLPSILPQRFDALACKLRYFSYVTARGMKERSDQNLSLNASFPFQWLYEHDLERTRYDVLQSCFVFSLPSTM